MQPFFARTHVQMWEVSIIMWNYLNKKTSKRILWSVFVDPGSGAAALAIAHSPQRNPIVNNTTTNDFALNHYNNGFSATPRNLAMRLDLIINIRMQIPILVIIHIIHSSRSKRPHHFTVSFYLIWKVISACNVTKHHLLSFGNKRWKSNTETMYDCIDNTIGKTCIAP